MRDKYQIFLGDLATPDAFDLVRVYLEKTKFIEQPTACQNIKYWLAPEAGRELSCLRFGEFLELVKLNAHASRLGTHSHWKTGDGKDLMWDIRVSQSCLTIAVESQLRGENLVSAVHAKLQDIFRAKNPASSQSPRTRFDVKKAIFLPHSGCGWESKLE
jgi:hypothetical protein